MSWLKRRTDNIKSIRDRPMLSLALLSTFYYGSLIGFKGGFIAYVVILSVRRIQICRMPTWRDITIYLAGYLFGVFCVSTGFSWLGLAGGRTDFTTTLLESASALIVGLLLFWYWIRD